jgi:hypothetical protein
MGTRAIVLSIVGVALIARPARADDRAAAEVEFVKAKRLMKEGKTAEACEAFARSDRFDPQNGTKYNLALCYEALGRTASAFVIFRELAQVDKNDERKADSARRAEALEPALVKLRVTVPQPTAGMIVTRDGADVSRLVGVEEPLDPGTYRIAASAEGYATWEQEVEVPADPGAVIAVEIPALERPRVVTVPEPPRPYSGRTRKLVGLSIGGGGIALTGVGMLFGWKAMSRWDEAQAVCDADLVCRDGEDSARAYQLMDSARNAGNVSTMLVIVGLSAIGAGAFVYLTTPDDVVLAPQVDRDTVGVVVGRSF